MAVVVLRIKSDRAVFRMPDPRGLPAAARDVLAGVWAYRANAEREAQARFARLAGDLLEVGSPAEAVLLAERAVADEEHHAKLCRELATTYGNIPAELQVVDAAPLGPHRLNRRARVLYETVAFCCITETLNTALMKVCGDAARVPEARVALRAIMRDEVRHSKIGWAHLCHERSHAGFIAELVPSMLAGAVREELFAPAPKHACANVLRDHGELSESERIEVFDSSVRDVIAPGLKAYGVDTRPLWEWVCHMRAGGTSKAKDVAYAI